MADKEVGCGKPTGKAVGEQEAGGSKTPATASESAAAPAPVTRIMVGKKAPDFEAPSFRNGEFGSVQLSDLLGRWVMLCFYPGDLTFV